MVESVRTAPNQPIFPAATVPFYVRFLGDAEPLHPHDVPNAYLPNGYDHLPATLLPLGRREQPNRAGLMINFCVFIL